MGTHYVGGGPHAMSFAVNGVTVVAKRSDLLRRQQRMRVVFYGSQWCVGPFSYSNVILQAISCIVVADGAIEGATGASAVVIVFAASRDRCPLREHHDVPR